MAREVMGILGIGTWMEIHEFLEMTLRELREIHGREPTPMEIEESIVEDEYQGVLLCEGCGKIFSHNMESEHTDCER